MRIQLTGKLTENIGGIGLFKHTFDINWGGELPLKNDVFAVPIGPAKIQGSVSVEPEAASPTFDDVIAHLQLVFLGATVWELKETLAKHIAMGAQQLNVHHGQISFVGTLTVTA